MIRHSSWNNGFIGNKIWIQHSVAVKTPDSNCGILSSIPGQPSVNQAVHSAGVDKLVAMQSTVGFCCRKIANVKAYGCAMAWMWLTQPVARLPHAHFLQLYVILEGDSTVMLLQVTWISKTQHFQNWSSGYWEIITICGDPKEVVANVSTSWNKKTDGTLDCYS